MKSQTWRRGAGGGCLDLLGMNPALWGCPLALRLVLALPLRCGGEKVPMPAGSCVGLSVSGWWKELMWARRR